MAFSTQESKDNRCSCCVCRQHVLFGIFITFVALVVAMMSLASLEGKKFEIETIIGQMGPALITTVVGMARIYLTQFDAINDEPKIKY